jgi:membrane associated rhomboid family serine protease
MPGPRAGASSSSAAPPTGTIDSSGAAAGGAVVGRPVSRRSTNQSDNNKSAVNDGGVKDEDVTCLAKFLYYTVGFAAYWFGSARFDMDGDGDFDANDVQAMLNGGAHKMRFNFTRPPQDKKVLKKRKKAKEKAKKHAAIEEELRKAHHEAEQRRNLDEHGAIAGGILNLGDHIQNLEERGVGGAMNLANADVEGEEEEAEILENLKQAWPWFTIVQVLLCFGLWAGFAFMDFPYSLHSANQKPDESSVLEDFKTSFNVHLQTCKYECSVNEVCVGVAFKEGPWAECKLLKALPDGGTFSPGKEGCTKEDWYWKVYRRDPWDLQVWLSNQGGLENWFPGQTALTSHYFCEEGFMLTLIYRWWSYQYTHGGLSHVGSNCFMSIVLGIPLEGLHGTCMFSIMWTVGVVGGAFNWLLFDPLRTSYGASGGCFSLLGMHIADLIVNWGNKKFRYMLILMLVLVTAVELFGFWANHSEDAEGSLTAHCVHVGGLVAGLLIGVCVGRNIHAERWEKCVQLSCWVIGVSMAIFSLVWWFTQNPFPAIANLWDISEKPWCWIGEVCVGESGGECPIYLPTARKPDWLREDPTTYNNYVFKQCVMCQTRECVEGWYSAEDADGNFMYCARSSSLGDCYDNILGDLWKDTFYYPPSTNSTGL